MTSQGLGLSVANEGPVADTVAMARRAEALGFDEISVPESRLHRSVTTVAAAVLAGTERIRVRIGVANPVLRHPVELALEAATLADLAPGRIRFGIGAAEWTMRALGTDPRAWRPYTHTVETVRAVRNLLAGERVGFAPTTFDVDADTRLDAPPAEPVPIDLGAVNARMMAAVGRHGDGVQLGALTSVAYTRWALARIAAGAAAAGRDPSGLLVSGNVLTSVDADRTSARDAVRAVLASYLARVEGVVVDESGADPSHVAHVRAEVAARGVAAGAAAVTEHLVDVFAVAGTPDEVAAGLARFVDAGLALPLVWHTIGPDPMLSLELVATDVRRALVDM